MFAEWLFEYEIPSVAAVAAAICSDITHVPEPVFGRRSDEMCSTAAINADDRGGRRFDTLQIVTNRIVAHRNSQAGAELHDTSPRIARISCAAS